MLNSLKVSFNKPNLTHVVQKKIIGKLLLCKGKHLFLLKMKRLYIFMHIGL